MRIYGNDNDPSSSVQSGMRTLLICHDGADLDRIALARWLASFSQLTGMVVLRETKKRGWRRIRREIRRVGIFRFLDVLAFRLFYKLFVAASDRQWEANTLRYLSEKYSPIEVPTLVANSPNSPEVESFIKELDPDFVIARCKTLLKESVFSIPSKGTFVMHPGICPEYRNAHGCFWALANNDRNRVGMTLLRIDRGVDTGPIYGYYYCPFDETIESHIVIQNRVVIENLAQLESKFGDIYNGTATPMEVVGRSSNSWGQPWLTKQFELKKRAKLRKQ